MQRIRLINSAGIKVWEQNINAGLTQLSIPHLPKGVYLLVTKSEVAKLIIQ